MNTILRNACLTALAALSAVSCAQTAEEDTNASAQRYFDAWREINYPSAVEKDGIYLLEDQPGTGLEWSANLPVSFITYTVRTLSGTVSSNSDETWARQLGTYDQTHYYGEQVVLTGEGMSYAGVDKILEGMREGGRRTAIIPAWMMTYSRYDNVDEYIKNVTDGTAAIYTITLYGQTESLSEYEFRGLRDYAREQWNVSDTLTTAAVFFKSFTEFEDEPVEIPSDSTVYINYTGRRLDGQVFDTTIADTAKVYHIYNSSKSYKPVSISWSESADGLTMSGSTSLISGFKHGLYAMHPDEKASFVFGYNLGYGSSASGSLIPAYAPLRFDIELVPAP